MRYNAVQAAQRGDHPVRLGLGARALWSLFSLYSLNYPFTSAQPPNFIPLKLPILHPFYREKRDTLNSAKGPNSHNFRERKRENTFI